MVSQQRGKSLCVDSLRHVQHWHQKRRSSSRKNEWNWKEDKTDSRTRNQNWRRSLHRGIFIFSRYFICKFSASPRISIQTNQLQMFQQWRCWKSTYFPTVSYMHRAINICKLNLIFPEDSSKPQRTLSIQLARSIRYQPPPLRFRLWQLSLMLGYQTPSWTAGVGPLLSLVLWVYHCMREITKPNIIPVRQHHKLCLSRSLECSDGMEMDLLYYQWCRIWSEWSINGVSPINIRVIEHSYANIMQLGPWNLLRRQWRAIPGHW